MHAKSILQCLNTCINPPKRKETKRNKIIYEAYRNETISKQPTETKRNKSKQNEIKTEPNETRRKLQETKKSNKIEQNEIKFKMFNINYYDLLKHII